MVLFFFFFFCKDKDKILSFFSFVEELGLFLFIFLFYFFFFFFLGFFFFFFFVFSRATPVVYGDSQARGLMGAVAAGLCHSHSNAGSEPRLQPTPQLMAMLDP